MTDGSPSAEGEVFPSQGSQDHAWRLVNVTDDIRFYVQCSKCGEIDYMSRSQALKSDSSCSNANDGQHCCTERSSDTEYDGWGELCE